MTDNQQAEPRAGRRRIRLAAALGAILLWIGSSTSSMSADKFRVIFVPSGTDSAQNPAFSPDGKTVLFTLFHAHYNCGNSGLYTIPLSGGAASALHDTGNQIVNEPGRCWNGVIDRITFSSDEGTGGDDIFLIAPNLSDICPTAPDPTVCNVTKGTKATVHYQEPSFSPDGKQIVLEKAVDVTSTCNPNEQQTHSIWKINSNGTKLIPLVNEARFFSREPNWSPIGDRIVFQRQDCAGTTNLYTINAIGIGPPRPVTCNKVVGSQSTDASWSPDGRWIVYSSDGDGRLNNDNLFITSADGLKQIRLTHDDATRTDDAPSWSPDGKWIVYESGAGALPDNCPNSSATELRLIAVPNLGSAAPAGCPTPTATRTARRTPTRTPTHARTRTPTPTRTRSRTPTRTPSPRAASRNTFDNEFTHDSIEYATTPWAL